MASASAVLLLPPSRLGCPSSPSQARTSARHARQPLDDTREGRLSSTISPPTVWSATVCRALAGNPALVTPPPVHHHHQVLNPLRFISRSLRVASAAASSSPPAPRSSFASSRSASSQLSPPQEDDVTIDALRSKFESDFVKIAESASGVRLLKLALGDGNELRLACTGPRTTSWKAKMYHAGVEEMVAIGPPPRKEDILRGVVSGGVALQLEVASTKRSGSSNSKDGTRDQGVMEEDVDVEDGSSNPTPTPRLLDANNLGQGSELQWSLVSASGTRHSVAVEFELAAEQASALGVRALYRVILSTRGLSFRLDVHNTSSEPKSVNAAIIPRWRVGNRQSISLQGLSGATMRKSLPPAKSRDKQTAQGEGTRVTAGDLLLPEGQHMFTGVRPRVTLFDRSRRFRLLIDGDGKLDSCVAEAAKSELVDSVTVGVCTADAVAIRPGEKWMARQNFFLLD